MAPSLVESDSAAGWSDASGASIIPELPSKNKARAKT